MPLAEVLRMLSQSTMVGTDRTLAGSEHWLGISSSSTSSYQDRKELICNKAIGKDTCMAFRGSACKFFVPDRTCALQYISSRDGDDTSILLNKSLQCLI
jgi:hypothetical protein